MQRIELSKRLKDLISKNEFLKAGDQIDQQHAQLADLLARKTYLEWGLSDIQGLRIDGKLASAQDAIVRGPERLTEEIATKIRAQIELSEEEQKNS